MSVLEVNNICKTFNLYTKNEKSVLRNCSLNVEIGSIFGLVGLNGIGKTTLIKIMLNMLTADSGNVSFFGIDSNDYNSRKNICYLPEKFQPSQYLSGYDFLEIALSFYKIKLNKDFAKEIAKKIDLDPSVLQYKSSDYSKGMGQKLGLISCFMSNAKLLILDEPMSGLDPKSRIMLKETLKEYRDEGGSIFFSSHILEDIGEICDDIAVLHNMSVKFRGHPDDLKIKFDSSSAEKAFLSCIES